MHTLGNTPPAEPAKKTIAPVFVADHLALDLLNSTASPAGAPHEWIGSGDALARWLDRAGVPLPPERAGQTRRGQLSAICAERVRDLREWLRGVVATRAGRQGLRPAAIDLAPLNALLAEERAYDEVVPANGRYLKTTRFRRSPCQAALLPLAEAAADLIATADFERVRLCEGTGCVLWFLDRTKAGRRRWCSMAVCGNRAKIAEFRRRAR